MSIEVTDELVGKIAVLSRLNELIRGDRQTRIEGGFGLKNLARYESLEVLLKRYRTPSGDGAAAEIVAPS